MGTTRVIHIVSGLVVALTPSPAAGQQVDDNTVTRRLAQSDSGVILRLTFTHRSPRQTGTFLGRTGDMLVVSGSNRVRDEIPLPNVSRMEMRTGFHRPLANFAFKGFGVGALLGAVWGTFAYERSIISHQQYAIMGAFWAGSAGVVIGWVAALGGQETWRPVTIDGWSPPTAPP